MAIKLEDVIYKLDVIKPQVEALCEEVIFLLYKELDIPPEELDNMSMKKKVDIINRFYVASQVLNEKIADNKRGT